MEKLFYWKGIQLKYNNKLIEITERDIVLVMLGAGIQSLIIFLIV